MSQTRLHVERTKSERRTEEPAAETAKATDTTALTSEMDSILDEIDAVLEENAEEFVRGYVQKGGE